MTIAEFFLAIDTEEFSAVERAISLLWFIGRDDASAGMTSRQICDVIEKHGHPRQNVSRLDGNLAVDRRDYRNRLHGCDYVDASDSAR